MERGYHTHFRGSHVSIYRELFGTNSAVHCAEDIRGENEYGGTGVVVRILIDTIHSVLYFVYCTVEWL